MTVPVWATFLALVVGWGLGVLQDVLREGWRYRREQTERRRETKRQSLKELQPAVIALTVRLEATLLRPDPDDQALQGFSHDIRKAGWQLTSLASRLADPDLLCMVQELRAIAEDITADEAHADPMQRRQRLNAAATAVIEHAGGIYQNLLSSDKPKPKRPWDGVKFFPI